MSSVPTHEDSLQRPEFIHPGVRFWYPDPNHHIVVYDVPIDDPGHNFDFAGFRFMDTGLMRRQHDPVPCGVLRLHAVLHNPEGSAYLSYHTYTASEYWTRARAAAWLIAHWYEHYMHNCPCQVDDGRPTNFREACIEALLEFNL